jgi:hypothetical protein
MGIYCNPVFELLEDIIFESYCVGGLWITGTYSLLRRVERFCLVEGAAGIGCCVSLGWVGIA